MNTWVYRWLNSRAKAWPYYKDDRAKQRGSIKDNLKSLREIMASRYRDGSFACFATVSRDGDLSLDWRGKYGRCALTGLVADQELARYIRLGIPVVDCRPAELGKLVNACLRSPLVAMNDHEIDPKPGALFRRPLGEHIAIMRDAGCTIHNWSE